MDRWGSARTHARRARDAMVATAVLAMVTAGCGALAGDYPAPEAGALAGPLACGDAPTLTGDPSLYRDEPVYGNATELTEAVGAWAAGQAGFEELWLDRDHHGWVHVGIYGRDGDVPALQEQVAAAFPGEGVVVVAVPYSEADLQELADRVHRELAAAGAPPGGGWAASVPRGRLEIYGVVGTPEALAALQAFAEEPLCVDVMRPEEIVPEGEQPAEGVGWRLLAHEQGSGEPYRTGVATTDEQLAALWPGTGVAGEPPPVDWDREVVVWFGAVYGSSCPIRLDGVTVDGTVLHPEIVVPGSGPMTACTEDANPHAFVVAVERTLLPVGPFAVQLSADDPPPGAPRERTQVQADLSAPGATATDDQLTAPDAAPQLPPLVEDGHPGMPEDGARYLWHPRPRCEGVVLGPLDGTLWRLADGEAAWAETDGQELTLHPVGDDEMVVMTPQRDYVFVRSRDDRCTG